MIDTLKYKYHYYDGRFYKKGKLLEKVEKETIAIRKKEIVLPKEIVTYLNNRAKNNCTYTQNIIDDYYKYYLAAKRGEKKVFYIIISDWSKKHSSSSITNKTTPLIATFVIRPIMLFSKEEFRFMEVIFSIAAIMQFSLFLLLVKHSYITAFTSSFNSLNAFLPSLN